MPDGLYRLHQSGQAHFLTFSCYHRQPFLAQMNMQEAFLLALDQTRRRFQIYVFGYVVMPEHVHLLLSEPVNGTIAKAMESLKTKVAVRARQEMGIEGATFGRHAISITMFATSRVLRRNYGTSIAIR